jgi:hypothetical protein
MGYSLLGHLRSTELPATAVRVRASSAQLRALLIATCLLAVGAAVLLGNPADTLREDLALARLLRCMALIKGAIVMAAGAAVYLRLGWSIPKPTAWIYVIASAVMAGSTMLIWQLTLIPLAALLFHLAGLSLLVVGWRER